MKEDKVLLWEVVAIAEEMGITVTEFLEILKWFHECFAIEYKDIDEDIIERISIYKNLNEAMKKLVNTDDLETLLDIDREEFITLNNLMVLTESKRIIAFDKER